MTLIKLIAKLESIRSEHGDMDVVGNIEDYTGYLLDEDVEVGLTTGSDRSVKLLYLTYRLWG